MDLKTTMMSDLQHEPFISAAMGLGLERSIFEPLRFITLRQRIGMESPDSLSPPLFGNKIPAIVPSPSLFQSLGIPPSGISNTGLNVLASVISGLAPSYDYSHINATTNRPSVHHLSMFKTASSPRLFLQPESVIGQIGVPFNTSGQVFNTKRETFSPYFFAPSDYIASTLYDRLVNIP